jgi:hypothetical protein
VSLHPEEWRHIARLSGATYKLTNPDARFFDAIKGKRKALQWAQNEGYVVTRPMFRVTWTDPETEERTYSDFDDSEEASEEADSLREEGYFGRVTNRKVSGWALGPQGVDYWKSCMADPIERGHLLAEALSPVWYAEAHGYDGVWWDELLDPYRLSAPRGGIFDVRDWSVEVV